MRQVIGIYRLLRSQGKTRREAIREVYRWLDDMLTLACGLAVYEKNERDRRNE